MTISMPLFCANTVIELFMRLQVCIDVVSRHTRIVVCCIIPADLNVFQLASSFFLLSFLSTLSELIETTDSSITLV